MLSTDAIVGYPVVDLLADHPTHWAGAAALPSLPLDNSQALHRGQAFLP